MEILEARGADIFFPRGEPGSEIGGDGWFLGELILLFAGTSVRLKVEQNQLVAGIA